MNDTRILVGQIIAAHGIKGEVKIHAFTAQPEAVAAYGKLQDETGTRTFTPKLRGVKGDQVIAHFKEVADRNSAEELAATRVKLYASRTALPKLRKGDYYLADLLGFAVVDGQGAALGTVEATHNFGAGDIAAVKAHSGSDFMLPLGGPFAMVKLAEKQIVADLPEGYRDAPKQPAPKKKRKP